MFSSYFRTALCALALSTGFIALNAALPKNEFRESITALVDEHHGAALQPSELHDKFFTEVFSEVVPLGTAIVPLNDGNCKALCAFVREASEEFAIPTPRLYLATDEKHLDARFVTHNSTAGILLHRRLFSRFNTHNLKHYLRNSVLKRLQAIQQQHTAAVDRREMRSGLNLGIPSAVALALLLAGNNSTVQNTIGSGSVAPWLNVLASVVAAAGAARYMHRQKRSLSTHAYEQISTHENTEFGREDVFPGPSEGRIESTIDAQPTHLLDVMLRIKKYIADENRKYRELQRLEEEEEAEMAAQMDEAVDNGAQVN